MISQVNGSAVSSAYMNNTAQNKPLKDVGTENARELSKAEKLKEAIESGEYKVDVSTLAEKMAEDLLQ